jgi:hypothetical protein
MKKIYRNIIKHNLQENHTSFKGLILKIGEKICFGKEIIQDKMVAYIT